MDAYVFGSEGFKINKTEIVWWVLLTDEVDAVDITEEVSSEKKGN